MCPSAQTTDCLCGLLFKFKVLPFGFSLSPRVFNRVVEAALSPLQISSLKILPYLDDWLICTPNHSQVVWDTRMVINHIQALGVKVNMKKRNLEPTQYTM